MPWETLLPEGVGIGIGVPAALALAMVVTGLLLGLKPNDALAVGLTLAIGAAPGFLSSRRASRVHRTLRHE